MFDDFLPIDDDLFLMVEDAVAQLGGVDLELFEAFADFGQVVD